MLQGEHSAILSTFIKLPFVIKIFVLSNFEWPFYTGFTVAVKLDIFNNTRLPSSSNLGPLFLFLRDIIPRFVNLAFNFEYYEKTSKYD